MTESGYPLEWEADVLLRDGHPVRLRPIGPGDAAGLRRFHSSLSAQTVYFRFFSAKPELTDADVQYFTHVDHQSRVALVVLDQGEICGVGRFDALGDGSAEIAFIIRDDLQGRGLGSILLEHLAAAARERNITRFVAEVLPANSRMLATFREAGYELSQHREEDVIAVSFEIEPTVSSTAVTAGREHRAEARSVQRLLQPRSVAVVGASRTVGGLGHLLLENLVAGGFTGDLVAVHPVAESIAGVRCVRSLVEAGSEIDVAVVVVPADAVPDVMADAAAAGVHALVVVSGGFGDAGSAGLALQGDLVAMAHASGMRLVGPNALGLINTAPDVRLNASLVTRMPNAGRVGFFCQSGALGSTILERFSERGLGLSTFVSAGNRADISGNDLLQYWEEDPGTDQVLLYLESIGNARKFARLVHRMAHVKPVAMVRTGGSGHAHPLGHAVASTLLMQRDVDQILAACGLIVVDSVDALIDVGRVATAQPLPDSAGVAIVGNSDALAVLAVNALSRTRLHAAAAPVTFARRESADAFESGVREAMADPAVGSVLAVYVPAAELDADAAIRSALRACAQCGRDAGKPVVAVMQRDVNVDDYGIPAFEDVEAAVHALDALTWLAEWRLADTRASAEAVTWLEHPGGTPTLEPGTLAGEPAARLLSEAGSSRVSIDPESPGTVGCRVRLVEDPLFGPVVMVSVDDPVAEALEDRACRLAPVTVVAAHDMLSMLGARDVAVQANTDRGAAFAALAQVISDVSRLHNLLPGVTSVDLRHVDVRTSGVVVLGDITIDIADQAVVADPTARRL